MSEERAQRLTVEDIVASTRAYWELDTVTAETDLVHDLRIDEDSMVEFLLFLQERHGIEFEVDLGDHFDVWTSPLDLIRRTLLGPGRYRGKDKELTPLTVRQLHARARSPSISQSS